MTSFLKTFLQTGLPFGLVMAVFFSLLDGWPLGVKLGVFSGVLFGLLVASFVKYQSIKFTRDRPLLDGEKLLKEGPANHQLPGEAVGGWVYLTDSRLLYVSHSINVNTHRMSIPLAEIESAARGRTLGLVPNQLKLELRNGQTEKFVVSGAGRWIEEIENLVRKREPQASSD